ncbi:MAG: tetratricopeptide repeat protein [Burkholderiales bacterium]|nr:tetratricopeptide repeat protein [Burkholderiales bacterium]
MKKNYFLLPLIGALPVLFSCSTTDTTPPLSKTRIEPLMKVSGADKTALGYYQLGRYYLGQNRLELAAEAYRNAIRQSASYVDARNALGVVYSKQGKFNEAISELSAALKIVPDVARVYNNLGYTYYLQGNFADAVTAYEKTVALEPDNQRAYNNLGAVYRQLGDTKKSRLAFLRAEELNSAAAARIEKSPAMAAVNPAPAAIAPPVSSTAEIATPSTAITGSAAGPILLTEPKSIALVNIFTPYQLPVLHDSIALSVAKSIEIAPTETSMPIDLSQPVTQAAQSLQIADLTQLAGPPALAFTLNQALAMPPINFAKTAIRPVPAVVPAVVPAIAPAIASPATQLAAQEQTKAFRLEIANGNGVTGMAKKVGKTLVSRGLPSARLTNIKPYREPQTIIQYRATFQGQALMLSKRMLKTPILVQSEHLRNNTDLRLVLGKDIKTQLALLGPAQEPTLHLASSEVKR